MDISFNHELRQHRIGGAQNPSQGGEWANPAPPLLDWQGLAAVDVVADALRLTPDAILLAARGLALVAVGVCFEVPRAFVGNPAPAVARCHASAFETATATATVVGTLCLTVTVMGAASLLEPRGSSFEELVQHG